MVPKTTEDRVCDLLHEVLMTEIKQSKMLDEVLELDLSPEGQNEIHSAWEEKRKEWEQTKLGETMELSDFFAIACKEANNSVTSTSVIWIQDYVEHGKFPISKTSALIKSLNSESPIGLKGMVEKLIALTCRSDDQNYLLEVLRTFQHALPAYLDSLVVGALSGIRPSYLGEYYAAKESLFTKLRFLSELNMDRIRSLAAMQETKEFVESKTNGLSDSGQLSRGPLEFREEDSVLIRNGEEFYLTTPKQVAIVAVLFKDYQKGIKQRPEKQIMRSVSQKTGLSLAADARIKDCFTGKLKWSDIITRSERGHYRLRED